MAIHRQMTWQIFAWEPALLIYIYIAHAAINPKVYAAKAEKQRSKYLFPERDARLKGDRESFHSWNSSSRKCWSLPGGEKLGETSKHFRRRMN